jgi:hypothetical protein
MVSTTIHQTIQTFKRSLARQWPTLAASDPRPVPRALMYALGTFVTALAIVEPVAAQTIGDAFCATGGGKLVSMAIGAFALVLAYLSIYDFYNGFKQGQSGQSNQRAQAGGQYRLGGKKLGGAVLIAGAPDFLSALGFTLLDCVSVAQIFA